MMQQAAYEFGFEADDIPLMIEAIPLSQDTIILVITSLMGTTMIAQAANYSAFPVCQEEKEDALQTAPELKLNQSYRVSFKNGVYTNPERTELYSVYETNKGVKVYSHIKWVL